MSDSATDIADYLDQLALGTIGADLFAHNEPPMPNDCVTVYNTGGFAGDYEIDFFRPTIQIRTRNVDPRAGFNRLTEIALSLSFPISFEVNGTRYIGVSPVGDMEPIGQDDRNRFITVQNFQIMREDA